MVNISPQEIIKSDLFIKEPVNEVKKQIYNNNQTQIVLKESRGAGKSIILNSLESDSLNTPIPTILTQFDSTIKFSLNPNQIFDESFFKHYFELVFSLNILSYIKKNYASLYENHFKNITIYLKDLYNKTIDYIDTICYKQENLPRLLSTKEISANILMELKEKLDLQDVNLAIDRFDWINGSSEYVQKLLRQYFSLFAKTIITSDDQTLNYNNLDAKDYCFINIMYGKDPMIIKQIVEKRFQKILDRKNNLYSFFADNRITNLIYQNLAYKANGNISIILNTFTEIAEIWKWQGGTIEDLAQQLNYEIDSQLNKSRKLQKMNISPKFYL